MLGMLSLSLALLIGFVTYITHPDMDNDGSWLFDTDTDGDGLCDSAPYSANANPNLAHPACYGFDINDDNDVVNDVVDTWPRDPANPGYVRLNLVQPTDESWKPGDPFEAPQPVVVPPDHTPTTTMMSSDHGAKEDTFPYSVGTPAPISGMHIGDMLWLWDDFILNQTQARLYRLQDLCVKVKLEGAELPVPGRTGDMIVVMTTQTPPSPGQGAQVVSGSALIRNLAEGSKEQETCLESGD